MATFRNSQLEEILNNERTMNRVILDRTAAHISSIGDDKAPPTQRDIKLEATLGTLIDALKEKINKAIQLISGHQYGSLDEAKVDRLMNLDNQRQELINTGYATETGDKAENALDLDYEEKKDKVDGDDDNVQVAQIPGKTIPYNGPKIKGEGMYSGRG
jgi:hypothetical protein